MLGARLRPSLHASCSIASIQRTYATAHPQSQELDHYKTLGVERNASTKSIKGAFYELSKKYHPDRHDGEDNKREAAEKFLQVASAYEILGSDEKRRAYDATIARQHSATSSTGYSSWQGTPHARARPTKAYTDIDIDYKNFEQFQRSARSRKNRARHDYFDMPDEFFAEFGGRGFSSEYQRAFRKSEQRANYKDSRAAEREKEERRIMREVEEEMRKSAHPIPTFEQLYRQRLEKDNEERKVSTAAAVLAAMALVFAFFLKRL